MRKWDIPSDSKAESIKGEPEDTDLNNSFQITSRRTLQQNDYKCIHNNIISFTPIVTSGLESYHIIIDHFAPKLQGFSYVGI